MRQQYFAIHPFVKKREKQINRCNESESPEAIYKNVPHYADFEELKMPGMTYGYHRDVAAFYDILVSTSPPLSEPVSVPGFDIANSIPTVQETLDVQMLNQAIHDQ